ncbi:hypothetical protein V8G54_008028 [Vigna mungo]|uniref:Reverse transcriptase Ty1/copia-type domain-containing protein n=1 Tax=Vigna mungo TaxID=3915 RepID=A0AAQ3P4G2_VIGMU
MNSDFSLKDLGHIHYIFGIEVQKNDSGTSLSQTKYIKDILTKFNMHTIFAYLTPMMVCRQFTTEGKPMTNGNLYRQAIAVLQYLTNTRPYIAFVVSKRSQYMRRWCKMGVQRLTFNV